MNRHFYATDALTEAAPQPTRKIITVRDIADYFPTLPIIDLWYNPNNHALKCATLDHAENMINNGQTTEELYKAYCAIWRNLTPRFSGTLSNYEMVTK